MFISRAAHDRIFDWICKFVDPLALDIDSDIFSSQVLAVLKKDETDENLQKYVKRTISSYLNQQQARHFVGELFLTFFDSTNEKEKESDNEKDPHDNGDNFSVSNNGNDKNAYHLSEKGRENKSWCDGSHYSLQHENQGHKQKRRRKGFLKRTTAEIEKEEQERFEEGIEEADEEEEEAERGRGGREGSGEIRGGNNTVEKYPNLSESTGAFHDEDNDVEGVISEDHKEEEEDRQSRPRRRLRHEEELEREGEKDLHESELTAETHQFQKNEKKIIENQSHQDMTTHTHRGCRKSHHFVYTCRLCGKTDHKIQDCPTIDKSKPPQGYFCRLCQSPNHFIEACPTIEKNRHNYSKDDNSYRKKEEDTNGTAKSQLNEHILPSSFSHHPSSYSQQNQDNHHLHPFPDANWKPPPPKFPPPPKHSSWTPPPPPHPPPPPLLPSFSPPSLSSSGFIMESKARSQKGIKFQGDQYSIVEARGRGGRGRGRDGRRDGGRGRTFIRGTGIIYTSSVSISQKSTFSSKRNIDQISTSITNLQSPPSVLSLSTASDMLAMKDEQEVKDITGIEASRTDQYKQESEKDKNDEKVDKVEETEKIEKDKVYESVLKRPKISPQHSQISPELQSRQQQQLLKSSSQEEIYCLIRSSSTFPSSDHSKQEERRNDGGEPGSEHGDKSEEHHNHNEEENACYNHQYSFRGYDYGGGRRGRGPRTMGMGFRAMHGARGRGVRGNLGGRYYSNISLSSSTSTSSATPNKSSSQYSHLQSPALNNQHHITSSHSHGATATSDSNTRTAITSWSAFKYMNPATDPRSKTLRISRGKEATTGNDILTTSENVLKAFPGLESQIESIEPIPPELTKGVGDITSGGWLVAFTERKSAEQATRIASKSLDVTCFVMWHDVNKYLKSK